MNIKTICMGFALLLASLPAAHADIIFNNWNGGGVVSCGSQPALHCANSPSFTLTDDTLITNINTAYSSRGGVTVNPTTVDIYDSSLDLVGSSVSTDNGGFFTGNFQTAAFSLVLTSGTYTVSVSDINDWAWNQSSGGYGFTEVDGTAAAPEPATWGMMMGVGFLGLLSAARRRLQSAKS